MTIQLHPNLGKNFCYAPWTNLHLSLNGDWRSCCAGRTPLGNINDPISSVLQSPILLEIKEAVLNNQVHKNCEHCIAQENSAHNSERLWYTEINNSQPIEIDSIEQSYITSIDIRWNTTCNLTCVYCDEQNSSSWGQVVNKQKTFEIKSANRSVIDDIINFLNQQRGNIKNIAMLGGEPLLLKENLEILKVLPDNVKIDIVTNLSVDLSKNKIFEELLKKNNVHWAISFEHVKEKFEYIRRGSSWKLLTDNIALLQDRIKNNSGHDIRSNGQYCVFNALDLLEIYQTFEEYNLPKLFWGILVGPSGLAVNQLPKFYINKAIEQINLAKPYWGKHTDHTDFFTFQLKYLSELNTTDNSINTLFDEIGRIENLLDDTNLQFSKLWSNVIREHP